MSDRDESPRPEPSPLGRPLLDRSALGRLLNRTPETIGNWERRGGILPPAIKLGGRSFWRPEDIEALLEGSRR